ncbi:glycosyltransferase [Coralloluteibacterium stylophorae]|uniref:Glycosyltransferase n=1 Tax=Coralloluteibacterium stylophorae TaxID=1776034 RepID=A0A8J8B0R1_9GAMM|nr:glycosyltransferase [Coralloluteibacterium stylophorae]MBS7456756.1 glycosyltransferase [Coralloluteibacterium stylophorae]
MNRIGSGLLYLRARMRSAWHRTRGSLRARGLRGTLARIVREFRPPAKVVPAALWLPASDAPIALPDPGAAPLASIVVPVHGQLDHTLRCLRALSAPARTRFEVIVVDDASPDATRATLAGTAHLRLHALAENQGFIGACNAGAALARGRVLVFLNNDTAPQPGWLDALVDTLDTVPGAGIAGARLVYPDGRLQEAGGILFANGQGWNFGRFDSPDAPPYTHLRDTDYVSGAALAIPAALFVELGGFDVRYAPAYYEDSDLAMRVRAAGRRVLYQPRATVVHFEGASAGTSLEHGMKAYQVVNQERFHARWRDVLAARHAPAGTEPEVAADWRAHRRVLVVDAATPQPDRDSGSLRLVNLMRLLRERGDAVTFFAANGWNGGDYARALEDLGVQVWSEPWLEGVPAWFRRHGRHLDAVIACRHYVAESLLPLTRRYAPDARFIFDTVDLHYLRERRGAEIAGDAAALRAAEATRRRELELVRRADLTWVVSDIERALLARELPDARVEILSNVHAVAGAGPGYGERRDLVFVGGFRHPPNIDAALWLGDEIMPRVHAALPGVCLHLIGAEPPEPVRALDGRHGIRVHGFVEDIVPFMDDCRIGLAPLRFGAGVKGKVNLAMAHGQPVVATSCAAEGMHLTDGVDVRIADDAEAFAAAVVELYRDPAQWTHLATGALANVERHFSFDAARRALGAALD